MTNLKFRSKDLGFGLDIPEKNFSEVLEACIKSGNKETGGILVGVYTPLHDWAIVTAVSRAPADSQQGKTWFFRGVTGLQKWLCSLWNTKREYYLGEWHFHPRHVPQPSFTDVGQMIAIANADSYQCPEPILLIVGDDPKGNWSVRAFVFPKGKSQLELIAATKPPPQNELMIGESANVTDRTQE